MANVGDSLRRLCSIQHRIYNLLGRVTECSSGGNHRAPVERRRDGAGGRHGRARLQRHRRSDARRDVAPPTGVRATHRQTAYVT